MRKCLLTCLLTLFGASTAIGQELNCDVSVNYDNLSGSDFSYLDQFELDLREYINRQSWTNHRVDLYERIDCTFTVVFQQAITLTRYRAQLIVASKRPIWGTTQGTQILAVSDNEWTFDYAQGNSLVSNRDRFDELTTMIDYYVYVILGYDFDTFIEFGGTPYFEQARTLADLGSSANAPGWTSLGDDRSRSSIAKQMLDPRFRILRQITYQYHYEGLDHFVRDTNRARSAVMSVLETLRDFTDSNTRTYTMDLFFSAKSKELAEVFRDSPQGGSAYDILATMDPSHLNDYEPLVN